MSSGEHPKSDLFWKPVAIVLGIVVVVLLACCGWLLFQNAYLSITASFADGQTQIFQQMTEEALASDSPGKAASCLQYVTWYYQSGTKQQQGTHLDSVVERHRAAASLAIIRHLRELTGKDLGDDPEPWLREFHQQTESPRND